jgi:hypothetical protein
LSLFDERDLAEIASPDFPGERLVVCKNHALAEERKRKRNELLEDLKQIQRRIVSKRKLAEAIAERRADTIGCNLKIVHGSGWDFFGTFHFGVQTRPIICAVAH